MINTLKHYAAFKGLTSTRTQDVEWETDDTWKIYQTHFGRLWMRIQPSCGDESWNVRYLHLMCAWSQRTDQPDSHTLPPAPSPVSGLHPPHVPPSHSPQQQMPDQDGSVCSESHSVLHKTTILECKAFSRHESRVFDTTQQHGSGRRRINGRPQCRNRGLFFKE